jgi:toxin ParE1/3/4
MKAEIRFSTQALQDLHGMHEYIAPRGGEIVASKFVTLIYDYCLSFETFPERGVLREDLRPGLRLVGYRGHATIAFAYRDGVATILRVFGRGQDVEAELLS